MVMGRNSASRLRCGLVLALWVGAAGVAQASLGADLRAALRRVEDGIEQQLRRVPASHEGARPHRAPAEVLEPWELVPV